MNQRPWGLVTRHDRAIAALAIPALGTLVADPLLSLVDTAFIGRLGEDQLGALGVSAAIFGLAFFAFNFLEYATTTLVATSVGAGDRIGAGRSAMTAMIVAVIGGVAVSVALISLTGPILGLMGAEGMLRTEAATYIRIRALAAPAVLLVRSAHGIFRGHQNTRTPLVVTLGINGINLVLDPLLIFGLGWGVAGAAWATAAAQWIGAAWFVGLLLTSHRVQMGLVLERFPLGAVRPLLTAGRDIVIRTVSLLAVFTYATSVAARIGSPSSTAVAAHQVVFQIWLFLALAVDSLAIAAQALIGRLRGAGDLQATRQVADRLAFLGLMVGLALAGLVAAVAPWLPDWFTVEPEVSAAIRGVYWFLVAGLPLSAVVFVWDGVFLGAGDFGFLAVAMAGASLVGIALMALVLPLGWGLPGVWWAITGLMVGRIVTLVARRASPSGPLHRPG
ncbi:MAG: MATE family efflux transporter [Acidimicrobiia bacterium]|nr:MATE family efflux transporter [Acidimicrobiia bacterium]